MKPAETPTIRSRHTYSPAEPDRVYRRAKSSEGKLWKRETLVYWGACRAPRPRHHLPVGRGGRHRPDGARHPRRHTPSSGATVMRMNGIRIQTERKPQDRSVRRAEKRRHKARRRRVRGRIRPPPGVCATKDTAQGKKRLFNWRNQAILPSNGGPLGECRLSSSLSCAGRSFLFHCIDNFWPYT